MQPAHFHVPTELFDRFNLIEGPREAHSITLVGGDVMLAVDYLLLLPCVEVVACNYEFVALYRLREDQDWDIVGIVPCENLRILFDAFERFDGEEDFIFWGADDFREFPDVLELDESGNQQA